MSGTATCGPSATVACASAARPARCSSGCAGTSVGSVRVAVGGTRDSSSPRSAGSSHATPPAAPNSVASTPSASREQRVGRQVGGEVVGDRLLGGQEALGGRGGASGPARRRARAGRRRPGGPARARGRRSPCEAAAVGPACRVSQHERDAGERRRSCGSRRAPGRRRAAARRRRRRPRRGRARRRARTGSSSAVAATALALPFDAPSTATSGGGGFGISVDDERAQEGRFPVDAGSAGDFTTVFEEIVKDPRSHDGCTADCRESRAPVTLVAQTRVSFGRGASARGPAYGSPRHPSSPGGTPA